MNVSEIAVKVHLEKVEELLKNLENETLLLKLEEAKKLYNAGNYSEAFKLALELMKEVRHQLIESKKASKSNNTTGIITAIEKHERNIERLLTVVEKLSEKGFNSTISKEKLTELLEKLKELEEKVKNGELNKTEAAKLLANYSSIIGEAFSSLKKMGHQVSKEKLKEAIEKILKKGNVPDNVKEKLQKMLNNLDKENVNMGETMKELKQVKKELHQHNKPKDHSNRGKNTSKNETPKTRGKPQNHQNKGHQNNQKGKEKEKAKK